MCARWHGAFTLNKMVKAVAVAKVLGGERTLGFRISSQQDLITAVRRGLSSATVQAVIDALNAPTTTVLSALRIARQTVELNKPEGRLLPQESERVYRLAKIIATADSVLGDKDKARNWMITPNRALGNATPLALTETGAGADEVQDLLGRIDFGVPS